MTSSFLNHFNNGDLRRAIDTPVLHHQQQQMSLKLTPENLRKGLAVMYAFGTWTLLGGMAFVYWGSNKDEPSALTPTYQDPNYKKHVVELNSPMYSIQMSSTVPEGWVPYSTRIYNKVQELFGSGK